MGVGSSRDSAFAGAVVCVRVYFASALCPPGIRRFVGFEQQWRGCGVRPTLKHGYQERRYCRHGVPKRVRMQEFRASSFLRGPTCNDWPRIAIHESEFAKFDSRPRLPKVRTEVSQIWMGLDTILVD